MANHEYKFVG